MMESLNGVPWHEAKLPFWVHRCKAQSWGMVQGHFVERCACGASRFDGRGWFGRNETRRMR